MLSVLIVCNKIDNFLLTTVRSVECLKPQILIDLSVNKGKSLGIRKNALINRAAYPWVLILDTDEVLSEELVQEIKFLINQKDKTVVGYKIPYLNYVFNHPVYYGGEKFLKARLFLKQYGTLLPLPIHEEVFIKGSVGQLNGIIHHYSYRSLDQVLTKFTKYAWLMAGEKRKVHEKVTLKKLFMYGPHMVWARAIKDEGWRDGWRGIVIALCFGYMETLTYWLLLWRNLF